jgi:hypothetical protein
VVALHLSKVWITHVASGVSVAAWSADRSGSRSVPGEVRTYAGGRRRAVVAEGVTGSVPFRLRSVPSADIATLESWFGQLIRWRDHRGQKFYGTFFSVERSERKDMIDLYDLSLTLEEMTYTEEV